MDEKTEWTLLEIVQQLGLCDYQCEGGALKDNTAFIALENLAKQQNAELADVGSTKD